MAAKKLGELLVRENIINMNQLEAARDEQKRTGGRIGAALVKLGYVNEVQWAEFLSKQYQIPSIDLSSFEIDADTIKLVPKELCEKHCLIPVSRSGNTIVIAMSDPTNIFVKDDLSYITRLRVEAVVAAETAIQTAIEKYYGSKISYEAIMTEMEREDEKTNIKTNVGQPEQSEIVDFDKNSADAPVIKFVNLMLAESIKTKTSDIHIEPYEKKFRVRFRIDGNLYEKVQPPPQMAAAIISRLKIMSNLDISERRRPQDGRLKLRLKGGKEIDFRVSVLPTLFGEKIVLRLLDKSNLQLDMTKLGFDPIELEKFKNAIHSPYGMVLITGPTGSGKTTTIYSALAELNKTDVNISTAEDPVEFNLEGINQVQMNPEVDLNFASALRSFLRQDPDIIMVGEIRDLETAEIAFKAALTGHLVVSTLHTNDAPSTINRLLNMGIEPFLVTSAVNLVVAQRLIRKICEKCKVPISVAPETLIDLGVPENEIADYKLMKGEGCPACNDIGFKGRIAIYEVMPITERIKHLIFQSANQIELKKAGVAEGMKTLRMSALANLKMGRTTIEEVLDNSAPDHVEAKEEAS
ncbi:MAG TPA: type IV-A pilus assembly ATPase PilB [Bdellovibrionales bacterium]|nr:type IV-A pilus assembly ATPase PilB [Bdellovibrionales bacterium]